MTASPPLFEFASRPLRAPERMPTVLDRMSRRTRPFVTHEASLALLMLLVALAARAAQFGNPVLHVDDQFYLLVGERMLWGDAPYSDIWDRKPVGLFLIYAFARLLGGDGVIQYQLLATGFAAATAFAIARMSRPMAGAHGGAAAGIVYLLFLGIFGGEGGQSPVFYNLIVVLAAWIVMPVVVRPGFGWRGFALGFAATGLAGLAIQIKYSVVFEGAFLGLALMWKAHREGVRWGPLAAMAVAWMAAGLAPTAAAWSWYAAQGQGETFMVANFLSILVRGHEAPWVLTKRVAGMAIFLAPLWLAAIAARRVPLRGIWDGERGARQFALIWAMASIAGVLLFGSYFDHYALPLIAPLAVAAAPLFGHARAGISFTAPGTAWRIPAAVALMGYAIVSSITIINENRRTRGWGPQVTALAQVVKQRLGPGCLFVYDGDPALYRMTHSCLPTRLAFPGHLVHAREDGAVGIDTLAETQRIMAGRPRLVVSTLEPDHAVNPRTNAFMRSQLARAYRPAFTQRIGGRYFTVFERRDGV